MQARALLAEPARIIYTWILIALKRAQAMEDLQKRKENELDNIHSMD